MRSTLTHTLYCVFVLCITSVCCITIQQYVDASWQKGARSVTIPPGTYWTSLNSYGVHLNLTHLYDFTLYAYNVTMICTSRVRAIDVTDSYNVSIYGLIVDYDPLTFTQGTIISLNKDYLDLQIHDGYPVEPWARINVIDPQTLFFKDGMGFMWGVSCNVTAPGVIRVYSGGTGFYTAEVGDYATLAGGADEGHPCHAVAVNLCSSISFIDVTVRCAPGFGMAEWGGDGGLILENFQIIPGPMPYNATMPRLQTTSWDGIEHASTTKGPYVNNLVVELAGDDTWSAVGDAWIIAGIDATNKEITLSGGEPYLLEEWDTLRLRNEELFPDEWVQIVKIDPGEYASLPLHVPYCSRCAAKAMRQVAVTPNFTVIVDQDIPSDWQVGFRLYSPSRQTSSFVLQNAYVRSKGRGALVKAPFGLIQNNYFYGGSCGIQAAPEVSGWTSSEAYVGYELIIRNNTIVHTGYHEPFDQASYGADGALSFFSFVTDSTIRDDSAFYNMIVEGNTFDQVNGLNIGITSSNGVLIANNTFNNTMPIKYSVEGQDYGFNNGYVVSLRLCNNVTLIGNIVEGPSSPYKVGNLFVENVTNLIGANGGIIQT